MGVSIFICIIDNLETLENVIKCVKKHNESKMENSGEHYTDEEFAKGDPMRYKMMTKVNKLLPFANVQTSCCEKWTRGENISNNGCLVKFKDKIWIEVHNNGGGLCTTLWLQKNYPELNWIGSHGKPDGFLDAPMVGTFKTWNELKRTYKKLIN